MTSGSRSLCLSIFAALCCLCFAKKNPSPAIMNINDVVVDQNKIFVEGKEFYIKAMAYQPMPLGISAMDPSGTGGGGLCSPRMTPWREYKSHCFDSDLFDGSNDTTREPPGPDQWFRQIWERDFPLLTELGANTLRLYNVNPTTRLASEELLATGWNKIQVANGKDHRQFMDYAHEHGLKVIFPLVGDETALTNDPEELLDQKLRNLIDEVGNHPALLMWALGNELAFSETGKPELRDRVNKKMDFIREYTLTKWNRLIPVTTCVIDLPETYDWLAHNMHVDVFCANAGYRSDSLTDLFSGNTARKFSGWKKLINETGSPLLIGEIGWPSVNNSILQTQPKWFNKVWKDVLDHTDEGCIGGVFFEYSDELYKQSGVDQRQLGVVELRPAADPQGQTSMSPNVMFADEAVKKPIIFDAVARGSLPGGAQMNFNTDVFEYIKRAQATKPTGPRPPIALPAPQAVAAPREGTTAPSTVNAPRSSGAGAPPERSMTPSTASRQALQCLERLSLVVAVILFFMNS